MIYERQFNSECINVASTYKHFTAIAQLSTKLGDTLDRSEELLDTILLMQRTDFQSVNNDKLQICYQLLVHFAKATKLAGGVWACLPSSIPRPV